MLLMYVVRILMDPISWMQTDLATHQKITAMGAFAMTTCLFAVVLTTQVRVITHDHLRALLTHIYFLSLTQTGCT